MANVAGLELSEQAYDVIRYRLQRGKKPNSKWWRSLSPFCKRVLQACADAGVGDGREQAMFDLVVEEVRRGDREVEQMRLSGVV